jgi:outer membrane receptor for ferrienterochelin and colicin
MIIVKYNLKSRGTAMKNLLFTLCLFLLSTIVFASENPAGKIEGKIIDKDTKQEIIGAIIEVMNTSHKTVTDVNGNFEISGMEERTYNLKITAPYYVIAYKTDVVVSSAQSAKILIEMKVSSYEFDAIEVSAARIFDKTSDMNVSTNALSPEEIRRAPGAVEDLNRMIQTLPGVTTATDSRNDLIVRGGSPIENYILVEGIEVPNINHFGTQGASGGPIGMINVDFLNDVSFSAGGFPAKYGDRLSSIMDIKYRDGDKNNLTGKFDLGIAGAGFIIEGPVQDGKSSYLFSARKSYLDLILPATGLTAVPNYTNFNLKVTYDLSKEHKLVLLGLGGIDKIKFGGIDDEDDPFIDKTDFDGWQSVVGLSHKWLVGNNTFIQSSLSNNLYQRSIESDSIGKPTFTNNSLDGEYIFKSDVSHRFSNSDLMELGVVTKYLRNDNEIFRSERVDEFENLLGEFNYNNTAEAFKFGSYIQYTKSLFNHVDLTLGLRYDYFDAINNNDVLSPRGSLSYSLLPNLKINTAYGIYHQAPPLLWIVGDERNKNLEFIKTNQFVSGLEYYPSEDIKMTLEFFNKDYSDYPASVTNPQVTYANAGAEYGTLGLEHLVPASEGYARGIEFFIQKKLTEDFYGMLNYSFTEIRFKSLDGIERPSVFDYKNVFTLILGYKFSKKIEVSTKYRFMGGRPYTPFDIEKSTSLNNDIYDYNLYNALRFDDYYRLDIRIDYRFEFNGWNLITFLDLQNALNKENVEQIVWNEKENRQDEVLQWKFLPVGGIKVEF